jgi:hypothetical protein
MVNHIFEKGNMRNEEEDEGGKISHVSNERGKTKRSMSNSRG